MVETPTAACLGPQRVSAHTNRSPRLSCKSCIINILRLVMTVRYPGLQQRRPVMIAILQFATLVIATLLPAPTAAAFHWLLLQETLLLIRPACTRGIAPRTELPLGTAA